MKKYTTMPNVKGMSGMDAISLLENLGIYVQFSGTGAVVSQSVSSGEKIVKGKTVFLTLS
jgi:cell division protein FtsI (penicillin-binding protein 3)